MIGGCHVRWRQAKNKGFGFLLCRKNPDPTCLCTVGQKPHPGSPTVWEQKAPGKNGGKKTIRKEPALRKLPSEAVDIGHWCSSALCAMTPPSPLVNCNPMKVRFRQGKTLLSGEEVGLWPLIFPSMCLWPRKRRLGRNSVFLWAEAKSEGEVSPPFY